MGADAALDAELVTAGALEAKARAYRDQVGHANHHHAASDPVGALGQVAADLVTAIGLSSEIAAVSPRPAAVCPRP